MRNSAYISDAQMRALLQLGKLVGREFVDVSTQFTERRDGPGGKVIVAPNLFGLGVRVEIYAGGCTYFASVL